MEKAEAKAAKAEAKAKAALNPPRRGRPRKVEKHVEDCKEQSPRPEKTKENNKRKKRSPTKETRASTSKCKKAETKETECKTAGPAQKKQKTPSGNPASTPARKRPMTPKPSPKKVDQRMVKAMAALEELQNKMPKSAMHFQFPEPGFSRKTLGIVQRNNCDLKTCGQQDLDIGHIMAQNSQLQTLRSYTVKDVSGKKSIGVVLYSRSFYVSKVSVDADSWPAEASQRGIEATSREIKCSYRCITPAGFEHVNIVFNMLI